MLKPHYFFALSLSHDAKTQLHERVGEIQELNAFKKWVHPQDYHLTLAFLGGVDPEELNIAIDNVEKLAQEHSAFSLCFNRFGTFGQEDSPRILWMGVQSSSELHQIHEQVFNGCEEAGFKLDSRPFSPHITVGRKWNKSIPFTKRWLEKFNPDQSVHFSIDEIVLYKTHPDRSPKYEAIYTIPLQKRQ